MCGFCDCVCWIECCCCAHCEECGAVHADCPSWLVCHDYYEWGDEFDCDLFEVTIVEEKEENTEEGWLEEVD